MTVPERPKGVQPRAWAVATAHLKDTPPKDEVPLPLPLTKVDPPKIKEDKIEDLDEDKEEED